MFLSSTGDIISPASVLHHAVRMLKRVSLPKVCFHNLRHTYTVMAIQSRAGIKTVQENLGHATAAFTLDVYGHVAVQMKRTSVDRMEQKIQAVSGL